MQAVSTQLTHGRPTRPTEQPDQDRFARNAAANTIIQRAGIQFGTIDVNVWNGEGTDCRMHWQELPEALPRRMPDRFAFVEDLHVKSAVRILCRIYEIRNGTFTLEAREGKFLRIRVADGLTSREDF